MLRNLLLSTVLATFATSALAADLSLPTTDSPYMAPSFFNWTGFYAGVNGGAVLGGQTLEALSFGGAAFSLSGISDRNMWLDGGSLGGVIGANVQYDHVVFGVEGDWDWSRLHGSRALAGTNITLNSNVDSFGTARGRLGYAFGRLLPYLTGGLYWQPTRVTLGAPTNLGPVGVAADADSFGWTLGGGLEYAVTSNWTVKGEYLYARANDFSFNYSTLVGAATAKTDGDVNIFRGGLNYKF